MVRTWQALSVRSLAILGMLVYAGPLLAQAWDGVATFKIGRIDTTQGQNFGFRVHGNQPMCGPGTPWWVYMNVTWDNYQATAALLTSAWLAGRQITVHSTKDAAGYCHIGYVSVI